MPGHVGAIVWSSFLLSTSLYLAAAALFWVMARPRAIPRLAPAWPASLLALGAVLQLLCLVVCSVADRRCPVYSLRTALGIVSLVGVVGFTTLSRGRRFEALGGFVAASAALFGVAAQAISARPDTPNQRWLMAIHITTNLLGGGLLLVAGGAASFYLWHARRLRHRHLLGQGAQLPPLESLDAVVHRLLWIGVPLLTVGMLTGRAAIKLVQIVTAGEKLRATLGVASWLVLLAVLALRHLARWRGRRLALATLLGAIGIFALIVLYVGRALVGDGL